MRSRYSPSCPRRSRCWNWVQNGAVDIMDGVNDTFKFIKRMNIAHQWLVAHRDAQYTWYSYRIEPRHFSKKHLKRGNYIPPHTISQSLALQSFRMDWNPSKCMQGYPTPSKVIKGEFLRFSYKHNRAEAATDHSAIPPRIFIPGVSNSRRRSVNLAAPSVRTLVWTSAIPVK